jgi:hypothetical protein
LEDRLKNEIDTHVAMATDEYIARGLPPEEARNAARRGFGGIMQAREAYHDAAGWPSVDALWQDVSYAVRTYRRTPGFAAVAIVTLALAIGATSAIFSLLNALVLRDLPVRNPETLVQLSTTTRIQGESFLTFSMLRELSARQQVFSAAIGASSTFDLKDPDVSLVYTPALQDPSASFKCFVIRGHNVPLAELRQAVEGLGRERVGEMVTLRYITDRSLLLERLTAMMSSFFGSLVLLLAGVGLFGLMSYAVAQRRREIGIRMALGADRRRVVRDVVRDGLTVTLAGLAVGAVAALAAVRLVKALLFGVTPQDPLTLVTAAASLVAIAILACWVPAARAARVDPMIALRAE